MLFPRRTTDVLLRPHLLPSSMTTARANRASSSSWTAAVRRASSSVEACRSPPALKCTSIAADAACTSRAASAPLARAAGSRKFEFSVFMLLFWIETARVTLLLTAESLTPRGDRMHPQADRRAPRGWHRFG